VLERARIAEGDTVLDVGCGDGLIAFGALERVGASGHVIFSDISRPLLDHCERTATDAGVRDRCSFVEARADDLSPVADESVDVVTTRSVLIYVKDKASAFREFHRVLRPGGRVSIFEPINRFGHDYAGQRGAWNAKGTPVEPLMQRINDFFSDLQPLEEDPMMDFDELDLLRAAEDAGFRRVHVEYRIDVVPAAPEPWDVIVNSPGNPRIPSLAGAMDKLFTPDERAMFEAHARPIVEAGGQPNRRAVVYLRATKERDA
jgi:ubiquinone/menaquinone biosynthesis C-methylase UbiE